MSDLKFKDKYRIPSARATWHDYDGGTYFITICTKYREHDFGEIEDGKMILSEIGAHTQKCIEGITHHNPYAEIPLYTIMPNHLHLIVVIDYDKTPHDKRTVDIVTMPVSHNETMAKETFPETSPNDKQIPVRDVSGNVSTFFFPKTCALNTDLFRVEYRLLAFFLLSLIRPQRLKRLSGQQQDCDNINPCHRTHADVA